MPERAIGTDQTKKFVYVVEADGKPQFREVRLGALADGMRVVQGSVKPGEHVVVDGLQRIQPGMTVAPQLLAVDAKGENVYAGTGPKGAIYRITADGKSSVFYQTRQEHVLCLGLADDGTLYAGTDKAGLVYKIDARGKGFVVFIVHYLDATEPGKPAEISTLVKRAVPGEQRKKKNHVSRGTLTCGPVA